jgi:hypothetical protein
MSTTVPTCDLCGWTVYDQLAPLDRWGIQYTPRHVVCPTTLIAQRIAAAIDAELARMFER